MSCRDLSTHSLSVSAGTTIRAAMVRLDQTAEKCLFVVDDEERVIGAFTDGDVRRAILSGNGLDRPIDGLYRTDPLVVIDRVDAEASALAIMKRHKVQVIPVVDEQRRLVRHITWTGVLGEPAQRDVAPLDVPVVIMAGGHGTRLEPFTKILPKPLIPVNDKPIIEHIIERFVKHGVRQFWLTVNYKSRIIKAYFQDQEPDYGIEFIEEPEPMGTAGSLQFLIGTIGTPFFVTNCDIIVNADYRQIMDFHTAGGYAITLVGSALHYQIPYGTCVINETGSLSHIAEKPEYDLIVNTGMYVLNPEVLSLLPKTGVFHITRLIDNVLQGGRAVGVFPVSQDSWIDVGQWKEYQRASERL